MVMESQILRFMARIIRTESGCWIHCGSRGSHGYSQFGHGSRQWGGLAHRFSWMAANGPIPDGMFVLHSCNVKTCVNPEHLRVGTNAENMDDVARGGYHPMRKLSSAQVRSIRDALSAGSSMEQISKRFGVDAKTVANIRDWKTYRYA